MNSYLIIKQDFSDQTLKLYHKTNFTLENHLGIILRKSVYDISNIRFIKFVTNFVILTFCAVMDMRFR